jgi:hypothetical protein
MRLIKHFLNFIKSSFFLPTSTLSTFHASNNTRFAIKKNLTSTTRAFRKFKLLSPNKNRAHFYFSQFFRLLIRLLINSLVFVLKAKLVRKETTQQEKRENG